MIHRGRDPDSPTEKRDDSQRALLGWTRRQPARRWGRRLLPLSLQAARGAIGADIGGLARELRRRLGRLQLCYHTGEGAGLLVRRCAIGNKMAVERGEDANAIARPPGRRSWARGASSAPSARLSALRVLKALAGLRAALKDHPTEGGAAPSENQKRARAR